MADFKERAWFSGARIIQDHDVMLAAQGAPSRYMIHAEGKGIVGDILATSPLAACALLDRDMEVGSDLEYRRVASVDFVRDQGYTVYSAPIHWDRGEADGFEPEFVRRVTANCSVAGWVVWREVGPNAARAK